MKDEVRNKLILHQIKLAEDLDLWMRMQTDFNYDEDFYRFCEWKMHMLDEEIEQIRYVLETGCCE